MNAKILAFLGGTLFLALVVAVPRDARAAESQALVQQVTALDDAAVAAYGAGDFDKMKKSLLKALAVGKDALATHAIMARVYLHLGVFYVDGLDNRATGVKYFGKALKIRPDIEVRSNMATKTVMSAFAEAAKDEPGSAGDAQASKPAPKEPIAEKNEKADKADKEAEKASPPEPERRPARAAASSEKCRSDAEVAEVRKQAREELDREEKALTMSKDALTKERADSEKLRHEKMDLERQLNEAKQRVAQLERETTQKTQQTAAGEQREKKERDGREALAKELEREKVERDRTIAEIKAKSQQSESDLKARLQQIERDKAEKEKLLAATTERERKERETRERLEKDRQTSDARDRERLSWEERARAERDKIEAVPPLPARIPEPVHCAIPDEVQGGADFFVNCVAQPGVKAKTIVFYYRPASATVYNSIVMDPTKKGWSRAVITANKLNGKLLQYYVEARDGRDTVAASNGKAGSPNIVPIAGPAARH